MISQQHKLDRKMKILYFAWIRERVGISQEEIDLPNDVKTVEGFLIWLKTRGEEFDYALENTSAVRVALDREHCSDFSQPLADIREIALFPPMTGG